MVIRSEGSWDREMTFGEWWRMLGTWKCWKCRVGTTSQSIGNARPWKIGWQVL